MRLIEDSVSIVGMGCVFPGAPDPATFWENICAKRSFIADHPDPHAARYLDPQSHDFERVYSLRGGYLGPLATFDPTKHGVMPADVQGGDGDQFLTLRAATAAIEDAGVDLDAIRRDRVEVILGHSTYFTPGNIAWFQLGMLEQTVDIIRGLNPELSAEEVARVREALKRSLPAMNAQTPATLIPNIVASRLSNRLDLMGPNYVVDAACATSHVALGNAVKDLLTDDCDYVLVGATQASCLVLELMLFCAIQGMSHLPALRPFDRRADGTMLGEGVGVLLLRRTKDAERDGNRIYSVIRGVGNASDGRAKGLMAPRREGQELAIRRAYEAAHGLDPQTVELVEAHGTGIPLGDVTEIAALTDVFGPRQGPRATCAVGTIKSMIGHCRSAAGIAGIIKATLALYHKTLPPTLQCEEPNPDLHLERSPFYINTETRPWIRPRGGTPRRAGVSAMGFGGVDAHCVLEEHAGN
jgi:acyl transferase domain-containing protein